MNYYCKYLSPIGMITLASDGKYLNGLWFDDQKYYPLFLNNYEFNENLEIFKLVIKWLDDYFNGNEPKYDIPIKLDGTDFRNNVWEILSKIPYGKYVTYGEIAENLANIKNIKKVSARAVGNAVGHNPISIIIPCHRVLGSKKKLTGYAGGIDKKVFLLKLENIEFN